MKRKSSFRAQVSSPGAKGLDDLVSVRVARITEIVTRMATLTIEARWGLSNTDLRLLNILDGAEPMAVSEMSRRAHVDKAWVSRSLRDLARRRLVRREEDPGDSRVALVSLSIRGQALLDEVRPFALRSEATLLENIDAGQLKSLLDRLESNAEVLLDRLRDTPAR